MKNEAVFKQKILHFLLFKGEIRIYKIGGDLIVIYSKLPINQRRQI
ncbi:unnamed protein product [Paramecium octaurelia]|uniref:Uncharacterized protein n=1 Tax=Paramecium octaurelia TaxID=43137 RepID=A0A8S1X6I0_PAROT|nr:unnamed protein product [Paramecium octaurelia]